MMLPGPHVPPRGSATAAMICAPPPVRSTRRKRPRAKKPSERPSGDQNGLDAPSVPVIGLVTKVVSERTKMWLPLASTPTYAIRPPSGEIAGVSSMVVPAGALIDSARVVVLVAGRRATAHVVSAVAA